MTASTPELILNQRRLIADLVRLVEERAQLESGVESALRSATLASEKEFGAARLRIASDYEAEKETAEQEYGEARATANTYFKDKIYAIEAQYDSVCANLTAETRQAEDEAKTGLEESVWETTALHEARRGEPQKHFEERKKQVDDSIARLTQIDHEIQVIVASNRQYRDYARTIEPVVAGRQVPDPFQGLAAFLTEAEQFLFELKNLSVPRFFQADKARAQFTSVYQPLRQAVMDGLALEGWCLQMAEQFRDFERADVEMRCSQDLRRAEEKHRRKMIEVHARRDWVLGQADQNTPRLLAEVQTAQAQTLAQMEAGHAQRLAQSKGRHDTQMQSIAAQIERRKKEAQKKFESQWSSMVGKWFDGMGQLRKMLSEIDTESRGLFVHLDQDWQPSNKTPHVMRFGEFKVDLEQLPGGLPHDERLRAATIPSFAMPALVPFPDGGSLLFSASDAGRQQAIEAIQAVMLRLLVSIPPGKLRFTLIDPVGLGQNFAAFMHLADYDDALISNRIWTEFQHIEQRLADLTEQMESVIQKYLRNEFKSIDEYNAHAGEVAEPYRFLVVANFPANFTESAARRLTSIAATGARCGVYTLIMVDQKQKLPQGFNLKDVEQHSTHLVWKDNRFHWTGSEFERFPLELDSLPSTDLCTRILKRVGEEARDASRVEVPFQSIAPPLDQMWTGSTANGISVPLGPSGATKRQHLALGKGTSQHVLVAGKTGSGKSTLLYALITNLALLYSPDEMELYLIDFKKGVEFKTYATHELPHARVVAIESEREFGQSVLQRLDAELKLRGDKYRELGVQDLAAYRKSGAKEIMPRIMLIVDEFQEMFTEDDKISQEVSLLLDRLVRQGRAFGIHVLLGSQTLGGAYSLARSTLGQMAVRIALQCSEADAHLILSEENTAARLLSRPGEAIYNDANGLLEGNHPFQVAWLGDEMREEYLIRIREMAERRPGSRRPQIIFEGTVPANVNKNHLLNELLSAADWPAAPAAAQAWLGEAVAIKDPTAAVFHRQSGSNLLIIGQQEPAAAAMLVTSVVSLAAQHGLAKGEAAQGSASFFILDGGLADGLHAGCLGRLAETLPHPIQVATSRGLPRLIGHVADEVERRQAANETHSPAIYLIVYDLGRFRDLRKKDDDYGFSRGGENQPADPSKQFATILREGPALGVHTLIWCDTLNNMSRTLDRPSQREFEMRILFQMSAADSSQLIDSPAASKLGLHRALFHSEDQNRLEKFRPYGFPHADWLQRVAQHFRREI